VYNSKRELWESQKVRIREKERERERERTISLRKNVHSVCQRVQGMPKDKKGMKRIEEKMRREKIRREREKKSRRVNIYIHTAVVCVYVFFS
jgi:uncharacterized metal-binding protein